MIIRCAVAVTIAALCVPRGVVAQSDSTLPSAGSYGVSFSIPEGGGSSFGVRKMISPTSNAGVNVQFGFRWVDPGPVNAPDDKTRLTLGLSPDVRLYRGQTRPVVPFVEVSAQASYSEIGTEAKIYGVGAGAGLGVEWFPTVRVSVSGSVGLNAGYSSLNSPDDERTIFSVGTARSNLMFNLYF